MSIENPQPRQKPYRITELMEKWNLSRDSVIRIVDKHPGVRVLKFKKNKTRLIPTSVEFEIWEKLRNRG